MIWKDIKNEYKSWPVNNCGYHVFPNRFHIKIGNEVWIRDGATIRDGAIINNGAIIGDGSIIGNGSKIGNGARIGNWTKIGDDAIVGDGAIIGDKSTIGDGSKIGKQLTYIVGSKHQIYLYDPAKKMIGIGCEVRTIETWLSDYKKIGAANGYAHNQIKEYKRYIDLFAASLT